MVTVAIVVCCYANTPRLVFFGDGFSSTITSSLVSQSLADRVVSIVKKWSSAHESVLCVVDRIACAGTRAQSPAVIGNGGPQSSLANVDRCCSNVLQTCLDVGFVELKYPFFWTC